ncbi:DNA gyrase inhibitor YacG [Verminephrobacter aporrectodeae subsp. tuberculatae]|uniref:DNA gyrase inhibitor YacG n=1 Tax=Verminephrobacter aporrectodeae TaxID=1110389 RepID=UPI002244E1B5|nr:DNA gyrase inhibitor YacG [Verminephrobacter aporrectodeae]MCW8197434.1 DNA gyrase inhibitor YacG [Verminephrobacter aporrectodeae subsp. tuberculatae]
MAQRTRTPHTATPPARTVTCPGCGADSVYSAANAYRPFCSARCKQVDLGAWASEDFRVPVEAPPADAPHGDPRLQH